MADLIDKFTKPFHLPQKSTCNFPYRQANIDNDLNQFLVDKINMSSLNFKICNYYRNGVKIGYNDIVLNLFISDYGERGIGSGTL